LKLFKKTKFKKVYWYWLFANLVIIIFIFILLFYKPHRYTPVKPTDFKNNSNQISSYLTHELLPQLYNGAQRQEPFDLIITQKGIKDIITQAKWPQESRGITLSAPEVFFVPENIIFMLTANLKGAEFIVSIVAAPTLDNEGLLNLQVAKVKVGVMNVTPLAKMMAKKMYSDHLAAADIDTRDLGAKITASLLNDEPFEPVFEIPGEDKKVRVKKITIVREKLIIHLTPAGP